MRGTGRRADREARGGAGTGRHAAARGQRGAWRRWGRGWRAVVGGRETCSGVLLQVGAFNIENAPRCILVPLYIYIYIYI
jgi:hypothetical protein